MCWFKISRRNRNVLTKENYIVSFLLLISIISHSSKSLLSFVTKKGRSSRRITFSWMGKTKTKIYCSKQNTLIVPSQIIGILIISQKFVWSHFSNCSHFSLVLPSTNGYIVCFCLFAFQAPLAIPHPITVRSCSLDVFFFSFYVASLFKSLWWNFGCFLMFLKWMQWLTVFTFQPFKMFVKARNNAEQRTKI